MIRKLQEVITLSWDENTCLGKFESGNISKGQCAVTSLVVNDFLGGKIMRVMTPYGSHYFNLINNCVVDLTLSQFFGYAPRYDEAEERTREYLLSNENTKSRYINLLNNVRKNIEKHDYSDNRLRRCLDKENKI